MKRKMLFAFWTCYALILSTVLAGDPEKHTQLRDTIILIPDSNIKILFIGESMKEMSTYQRIDTVKMMLVNDVQKSLSNADYPKYSKTSHYFISQEGKRRLKAENENYPEQEIDVEKEFRALSLGLYPYSYFIHDIQYGYEIQIYLSDPGQLNSLVNYNLGKAVLLSGDKEVYRNSFRSDFERRDSEWILTKTNRLRQDAIEISPSFGFGLIGNQWSPAVGIDLQLTLTNKYGISAYKVGLSYLAYSFTQSNTLDFENINFVQSYTLKFMHNISSSARKGESARWFGLTAGRMKSSKESMLDNRFKAGMIAEGFGPVSFSFDVIFLKNKQSVYGMTVLLPF